MPLRLSITGGASFSESITWKSDDVLVPLPVGTTAEAKVRAYLESPDVIVKFSTSPGASDGLITLTDPGVTPLSATTNCSSAAENAQTMLIAPFSSTQTGHGTETIASGDTINACRAVGIAKTSNTASSATLGIRHRVGGVDTTSAPHTLTTTDAVYRGTVFTTSTTNLDSAEIGAVRNAGSRTLTVEDMWLMVDYTAAGGEPEPPPLRSLALLGVGQ